MKRLVLLSTLLLLFTGLVVGGINVEAKGKHHRNSTPKSGPLTQAQITAWVTSHPCLCGPTTTGGNPTLVSIQQITFGQAEAAMASPRSMYLPLPAPSDPVFLVELHGPF